MEENVRRNRLGGEKSPYLQQHAGTPVDWYPWGEEAFRKAQAESRPVFLSIGYSTCHWCHVMARESFQDVDVARILNQHFIPVKLDREERPDIDNYYMQAVMLLAGNGGWPMNLFLTPDGRPFFAGTYFALDRQGGRPGFKEVLLSVKEVWEKERGKVDQTADKIMALLKEARPSPEPSPVEASLLQKVFQSMESHFDRKNGGFGIRPKFPQPHSLSFLLRYWSRSRNQEALFMVNRTLQALSRGGIRDHLRGGFHRYSVDQFWQLPHFEKMLCDQALLTVAYLETYQVTGQMDYKRVAEETIEYVLGNLHDEGGGFYSAEDADSLPRRDASASPPVDVLEEGAYYLWDVHEIDSCLSKEEKEIFAYYYGIKTSGNIRSGPKGAFPQKNILMIEQDLLQTARHFRKRPEEIEECLCLARKRLRGAQAQRPRPHRDDKILADWNGLMMAALSLGARVLNKPQYARSAEQTADFLLKNLVRDDGRLFHRYRDQEAAVLGMLDDYAFFIYGLIELYQATFKVEYLQKAHMLTESMIELFEDPSEGGFFLTGQDDPQIIDRQKYIYSGALPSGNALAAWDLIRLSQFTGQTEWYAKAEKLCRFFSSVIQEAPATYPQLLVACDLLLGPRQEIIFIGRQENPEVQAMLDHLNQSFAPHAVVSLVPPCAGETEKQEFLKAFFYAKKHKQACPAVYICQQETCREPITDFSEFTTAMQALDR